MSRRVAVTGIGVVSCLGLSTADFWSGCLEGRTAIAPIPGHWWKFADYHSTLWSPLPALDADALGASRIEMAQNDPVSLIAARAAREALAQSGITLKEKNKRARSFVASGVDPARAGVFIGTVVGGATSFLRNHAFHLLSRHKARLGEIRASAGGDDARLGEISDVMENMVFGSRFNPFVVSMLMPNAAAAFLGQKFSFTGANRTSTLACASGTVAIGNAFGAIRAGKLDLALAGGSEYLHDHYGSIFLGFDVAGALTRDCADPDLANRPFDEARSGFLFSEGGAAVLVLEPLDDARRRGAPVLAEIAGFAESFDAYSMMQIAPEGMQIENMIRGALDDAGLAAGDIQYINAHGTGTQSNDAVEAEVIGRVFGPRVLVNSTKSLIGHTIGASGAIEAAVTVLSLNEQTTHVCRSLRAPIADLDFVRRVESRDISAALSQSFAFGGHNAGLVLRRARE